MAILMMGAAYLSETQMPPHQTTLRHKLLTQFVAPVSSVSIATRYGLDGPGIKSRWRARFSAPVQTGPGAHPASYTMGTGSLSGGKAAGAWR
jgi:hypothetical protein